MPTSAWKDIKVVELPELRDKVRVFYNRVDAGMRVAQLLKEYRDTDAIIMAIPAGGVPVAVEIARQLDLPIDVVTVSKITPSWNTEVGYGAVAADGTVWYDKEMADHMGLSEREIEGGIERAKEKVARRQSLFRGERPMPDMKGGTVIVVDDGLASGVTMTVAVGALKKAGARSIVVAVPTAHAEAIHRLAGQVDAVYCPNIRAGWQFAVAEAYQRWTDVNEQEATKVLDVELARRAMP
jgi:predicted phosphoribosyltransferase